MPITKQFVKDLYQKKLKDEDRRYPGINKAAFRPCNTFNQVKNIYDKTKPLGGKFKDLNLRPLGIRRSQYRPHFYKVDDDTYSLIVGGFNGESDIKLATKITWKRNGEILMYDSYLWMADLVVAEVLPTGVNYKYFYGKPYLMLSDWSSSRYYRFSDGLPLTLVRKNGRFRVTNPVQEYGYKLNVEKANKVIKLANKLEPIVRNYHDMVSDADVSDLPVFKYGRWLINFNYRKFNAWKLARHIYKYMTRPQYGMPITFDQAWEIFIERQLMYEEAETEYPVTIGKPVKNKIFNKSSVTLISNTG